MTLIQHYVKALNQDEGLSIESAVGKVIHEETKKAIENAEKSYRKYMADHVPLPTKDLLTFANGTTIAFDLARKSFVESIVPGQQGEDLELFQVPRPHMDIIPYKFVKCVTRPKINKHYSSLWMTLPHGFIK